MSERIQLYAGDLAAQRIPLELHQAAAYMAASQGHLWATPRNHIPRTGGVEALLAAKTARPEEIAGWLEEIHSGTRGVHLGLKLASALTEEYDVPLYHNQWSEDPVCWIVNPWGLQIAIKNGRWVCLQARWYPEYSYPHQGWVFDPGVADGIAFERHGQLLLDVAEAAAKALGPLPTAFIDAVWARVKVDQDTLLSETAADFRRRFGESPLDFLKEAAFELEVAGSHGQSWDRLMNAILYPPQN